MSDFISAYRLAVKVSVNPVVAYVVGSFGSLDALMRYSVCPLDANGALADSLDATRFVFMGNVVARGDFNAMHPEWAEACKTATPRITSAGLGGQSRDESELKRLQANVAMAIPSGWVQRAIASAKLTSAPTIAPVADNVADAVAATLQPEETRQHVPTLVSAPMPTASDSLTPEQREQIAAATARAQGPKLARPKRS